MKLRKGSNAKARQVERRLGAHEDAGKPRSGYHVPGSMNPHKGSGAHKRMKGADRSRAALAARGL